MRFNKPLLAAGLLFSLTSLNAEAALTPYTSVGQSLVYSSVSNITWTGDANLLGTLESQQGTDAIINAIIAANYGVVHDTPNYYDNGTHTLSSADFNGNGQGTASWWGAQAFVGYLNSIHYGGSSQWALPGAGANPQYGYNQTGDQFGQLYYNELNALAYPGTNYDDYGILHDGSYDTSGNAGPFANAQTYAYWSGTEYASNPFVAWLFYTDNGLQVSNYKNLQLYAWAVSPGQVSAVPVPGAVWLFGTGLVGLLGLKRRGHAG